MQTRTTLLDEALEAFQETRAGVLAEAQVIADAHWDFRPAAGARSVSELVLHIVESGLLMAGELSREDGDFGRKPYPELLDEYAGHLPQGPDPARLRALLVSTHEDGARRIQGAGELHMLQHIRRFDGQMGTRLAWMNHAIAHEYYHRGQLALYARQVGVTPALTRVIHGG